VVRKSKAQQGRQGRKAGARVELKQSRAWRIVSVRTSVKCLSTKVDETCRPMTLHGRGHRRNAWTLRAARPPLYVLTRFTTNLHERNIETNITLSLPPTPSMCTTTGYSFPRLRNLFGSSTCLDRMNSATFFPKKSYELEQLTPRSR
jgi:hypothetical protein